jgi:hypothetical protein
MTLCLTLLLATLGDLPGTLSEPEPEPTPPPGGDRILLRVRGGMWSSSGFDFDAFTTSSTEMRSKQKTLLSVGLDAGASILSERFVIFASIEESSASKINLEDVGFCVGFRDWSGPTASAGVPNEALIYAGPLFGRFDVTTSGFGTFDTGIGVRAGLSLTWKLSPPFAVSLVGEYRWLKFDLKDKSAIASGDKSIGGSGYWIGAGVDLRF